MYIYIDTCVCTRVAIACALVCTGWPLSACILISHSYTCTCIYVFTYIRVHFHGLPYFVPSRARDNYCQQPAYTYTRHFYIYIYIYIYIKMYMFTCVCTRTAVPCALMDTGWVSSVARMYTSFLYTCICINTYVYACMYKRCSEL